jgi:exosome complex RNA-binding protein Rrp42 (RNase PH superfamily)
LQKTLASSLTSSAIPRDQFIVLRSASSPFQPTKAWSLHLDVTFTNIQGGNLADVMFAAVWAALNSVRLPRTRAIGFDTDLLNNRQTEGNLDSFDIKGSLAKTRGIAGGKKGKGATDTSSGQELATIDPSIREKTGVDFEVLDVWDNGATIEGSSNFPLAVTVNMLPGGALLDATLSEESCFPASRRLLILCSPLSGNIAGVQMINSTLDSGINSTGEDTSASKGRMLGTADYKAVQQAMLVSLPFRTQLKIKADEEAQSGQEYARGLYGAIQSQMAATKDNAMQMV